MRIAIVAPIEETVPPTKYGGTEWIVYRVALGLGQKGHSIDLYASGDSKQESSYHLIPLIERSIRLLPKYHDDSELRKSVKLITLASAVKNMRDKGYDLIHNHTGWRLLLFANFLDTPIVTTHHMPLSLPYQHEVLIAYKDKPHISISNNQRKDLPELNFVATIYNGTDISTYPSNELVEKDAPMAFLARMSHEKGAIEAATVAHECNKQIVVAAKVDAVDESYFAQFQPLIDNTYVIYKAELALVEKTTLLQKAKCLLVPIKWEEPFGLMFTEAMSCGTPVVTFARGSAPEIVIDGVTGFLVNQSEELKRGDYIVKKTGVEGLCEAVERLYALPEGEYQTMRKAARKRVEEHFTTTRMVDAYEKVFERIIQEK